jgi:predicted ATPase
LQQGAYAEAIVEIKKGLDLNHAIGSVLINPFWMGHLASALGRNGQTEEGLVTIAEAFDLVARTDDRMTVAELHRVKGELMFESDAANEAQAEACFHEAIDVARAQNAKTCEVRAATSLARLWQQQGKRREARDLLAPVYAWFTEGLDTSDLKQARSLLDELEAPVPTIPLGRHSRARPNCLDTKLSRHWPL